MRHELRQRRVRVSRLAAQSTRRSDREAEADQAAHIRGLEAFARHASSLQKLMDALARTVRVGQVGEVAASYGRELFGAAASLLFLLVDGADALELVSFGGVTSDRTDPYTRMPLGLEAPLPRAVRTGEPVWVSSREELLAAWPGLAEVRDERGAPLAGVVAVPIRDTHRVIGGLGFSFYTPPELDGVRRDLFLTVASQCGVAIERARSFEAERRALEAESRANERLQRQQERLAVLANVAERLATSLDPRRALVELVEASVPGLADWCIIHEVGETGRIEQIALHHRDPARVALAERLQREYPPPDDPTQGIARVLSTGETEWVAEIPDSLLEASARDAVHLELIRGLKLCSYATIPLKARGRILGAISLITERPRRISEEDLAFAEELARRTALALENARLFQATASARGHLHQLLMQLPASIAILRGRELRYELLNDRGQALVGPAEVVGRTVGEVFPELAETGLVGRMQRVFDTGEPYVANEVPLAITHDGRAGYANLVFQPMRDEGGTIDGVVTFAFEVTEQVEARRRIELLVADLARSESRMRALVEATTAIVWSTNAHGERVEISPSWLAFTGQTADQYLNGGWISAVHPDDRDRCLASWRVAVASGDSYSCEYRLRRTDGSYAHVLARGMPVKHLGGQVVEYIGCNVDVTDLRRAEAESREQSATLESLNQLAHVIAAELDTAKVVQSVIDVATRLTKAEFGAFFYNVDDGRGGTYVLDALSGVSRERFEVFAAARNGELFGPTFRGEGVIRLADVTLDPRHGDAARHPGPDAPLAVRSYLAVPVISRTGTVIGGIFLGHSSAGVFDPRAEALAVRLAEKATLAMDNARLHEDSQRLIRALEGTNRDLDQFAYVASHDLKAPLRGIGSLAEWIEEDLGASIPEAAQTKLGLLRRRVHRLEALIQGILDFSRIGRVAAKREEVAVGRLVGEIAELLAPATPRGGTDGPAMSVTVEGELPVLYTERVALQQVFMNLIGNALKHARREDARVVVSAREYAEEWEFRVADNGPGIAPEFHERVWAMFQTLEARDKVESTGVGLAIVKKIVQGHRGRVWIESEEGAGATFCFTWPTSSAPRPTPSGHDESPPGRTGDRGPNPHPRAED